MADLWFESDGTAHVRGPRGAPPGALVVRPSLAPALREAVAVLGALPPPFRADLAVMDTMEPGLYARNPAAKRAMLRGLGTTRSPDSVLDAAPEHGSQRLKWLAPSTKDVLLEWMKMLNESHRRCVVLRGQLVCQPE